MCTSLTANSSESGPHDLLQTPFKEFQHYWLHELQDTTIHIKHHVSCLTVHWCSQLSILYLQKLFSLRISTSLRRHVGWFVFKCEDSSISSLLYIFHKTPHILPDALSHFSSVHATTQRQKYLTLATHTAANDIHRAGNWAYMKSKRNNFWI